MQDDRNDTIRSPPPTKKKKKKENNMKAKLSMSQNGQSEQ